MSKLTTLEYVLASFCLITFIGTLIMIGVYLHWGNTKTEEIMNHVKNCKIINNNRFYLYMGAWGRMAMMGMISGFLAFPGYHLRKGMLDIDDINNFPELLKKKLIMSFYIGWGILISLALEVIAIKITRS